MNTMNIITDYSTDVDLQWVASAAMKYSVLVYVPNLIGKIYVLCAIQRDRSALLYIGDLATAVSTCKSVHDVHHLESNVKLGARSVNLRPFVHAGAMYKMIANLVLW